MLMKRTRVALLAGLVLASAPVALRAFEDKAPADKAAPEKVAEPKDKGTPAPVTATPGPGCGGCGPTTCYVNEWVPEYYTTTRTTYKTEWREECYTAYKTEYVKEMRTHKVCTYVNQPCEEWRTVCKCVGEVPCVETRCVRKKVETCKPVTVHHRKLVRLGHWECHEVCSCKKSCDPCGGCCTPCTRTVRKWVCCPEYEDCCETKMVKCCDWVSCQEQVTVCKKQYVQEKVKVCVNKCVPCYKDVTCEVCVPKCVPYQCTRKVKHCVPCTENVTCCRMVCKKKEVTCQPCCTPCCEHKCHRFSFSFKRHCGCDSCCGCN